MIYSNNLDSDPGWTTGGQWAWGTPTGGSGDHGGPDPTAGYSGTSIYGYNLSGGYANLMFTTYWLTTQAINCSGCTSVHLKFYRWLGVDNSTYDHAYIAVSNNGSTWTTVWSNPTTTINETAWSLQNLDISAYADNKTTVYIRWGMGPTNSPITYCGWNIDDVSLVTELTVDSITPNSGINTGSVNITNLTGTNLQSGATVKLTKPSQMDINATAVNVVDATQIACTLNLLDAARGPWNVVVTNPDNETSVLFDGFTVTGPVRTIYVKSTGSDNNNGLSWNQAKQTVQGGLNTAASGDQVWVAQGIYNERINLTSGVSLYGGFIGTETDLSQRDFRTNLTILDGQAAGSVVTPPAGADNTTRIDGFTIRNGNGTLSGSYRYGGGVYCSSSSPTISNNMINGNSGNGGAIACVNSSSPTILDNTISGNSGNNEHGGGIYCSSSSPTISSNTISGNTASSSGGGFGGGIYCYSSSAIISNNTISGNTAFTWGGGILCSNSSVIIRNNTISGNSAPNYGRAGGIYCTGSSGTISNNTISGNSASTDGGGIYCNSSSPTIINNMICRNIASGSGGGIYCFYQSSPTIRNNTISGNSASPNGGGIFSDHYSSPSLVNNIIAFNGTGFYHESGGGTPVLRNNCIFNPGGLNYTNQSVGTGDIQQDPLFVDLEGGNFHITGGSPCINGGNNADVQPGWPDIDGQARIYGTNVDMGADESLFTIPADCDGDGHVTAADLAIVLASMDKSTGDTEYDGRANLDGDQLITSTDLSIVLANME